MALHAITLGVFDRLDAISWWEYNLRQTALDRLARARAADQRRLAWQVAVLTNGGLSRAPSLEQYMWPKPPQILKGKSLDAARANRDRLIAEAEAVLGAPIKRGVDATEAIRAWLPRASHSPEAPR
ncbi:MAG TPA: hypothetical protein VFH61_05650 [Thermoleophilia bacterium]|nr:hypothetical protein [Thermoleophilia bacterium]